MIRLDKIKIVCNINDIIDINDNCFKSIIKNGEIIEQKFEQQTPFLLYIEADYKEEELIIEFTGKILLDKYPALINKDTIRDCFEYINSMNICKLNVDHIISTGQVCKIDVTADVQYPNIKELTTDINANISSHKRYTAKQIGDNLIIDKNVKTKTKKLRLSIYDKEREITKADNREFLSKLSRPDYVLDYFKGKVRFELNINSMEQIRKNLKLRNLCLLNVLDSDENPIREFLFLVLNKDINCSSKLNLRDRERECFLRYHNFDIKEIECIVRSYSSKNVGRALEPYKRIMQKRNQQSIGLRDRLSALLPEIVILFFFVSI